MRIIIAKTKDEITSHLLIRYQVFVLEQQIPFELECDYLDEEAILFLGYDNDTPIAAGRLRIINDYAKIERICILKEYRINKKGKELMMYIEEYAKAHYKISQFVVHAQENVIIFYEKNGYLKIDNPFIEADIIHQKMIKNIDIM